MTIRYSKSPSKRQLKVSEELRKQVSHLILRGDIYHPAIESAMVSIIDVRISPDLRVATIFFTHMHGKRNDILQAFKILCPEIRRMLASKVKLRFMPEIRFVYDDSIDNSVRIEELLNA